MICFLQRFSCKAESRSCLQTTDFASFCFQKPQLFGGVIGRREGVTSVSVGMQNSENRREAIFPKTTCGLQVRFARAAAPAPTPSQSPRQVDHGKEELHGTSSVQSWQIPHAKCEILSIHAKKKKKRILEC